jgi:hypothetical protein
MMGTNRRVLLGCLLLLSLSACKRLQGGAAETYLPEDAVAVVAVPHIGQALRAWKTVEGKFSDLEPVRRALARGKADIVKEAEFDPDQPDSLRQLGVDLDGGIYYALSASGKDHAIVIGASDTAKLDAYLRRLLQRGDKTLQFDERTVNGVKVTVAGTGTRPRLAWTALRRHLLLCPEAQGEKLAEHVAHLARLDRSLAGSRAFKQAREKIGRHHLLVYGDMARAQQLIAGAWPLVGTAMAGQLGGWQDYRTLAFGLALSAEEILVRMYTELAEGRGKTFAELARGTGKAAPFGQHLPAETMGLLRFSFNAARILDHLGTVLPPKQKRSLYEGIEAFEQAAKIDVKKDLLPVLAGRFVLAGLTPALGTIHKGMKEVDVVRALPGMVMVQVADEKRAAELLASLERAMVVRGLPVRSRVEGERKIYWVEQDGQAAVRWIVARELLILATGDELLRTLARLGKGDLGERLDHPRARAALRADDGMVLYLNLSRLTDMLRDMNTRTPEAGLDGTIMVLAKFRDIALTSEIAGDSATGEFSVRLR